jgi:hypothetical protein
MMVFWDVTLHHSVRGCQRLEGICSFHLQGRRHPQPEVFTEMYYLDILDIQLQSATLQNVLNFVLSVLRI